MKYQVQINEKLLNKIISAAYGDANFLEKIRIHFLAARNNEVKKLLAEYKITAKAVEEIKPEECPAEILENIKRNTSIEDNNLFSPVLKFLHAFLYKPAIATIAVLILVSGMIFFAFFNKTGKDQYSKAQVQLAEKQVKESLVLVNKIFNKTADKVENDILKKQVAKPVYEGISIINNLFKGG